MLIIDFINYKKQGLPLQSLELLPMKSFTKKTRHNFVGTLAYMAAPIFLIFAPYLESTF